MKCIQLYLHEMPELFEQYEDPSYLWCAQFLKDNSDDIKSAARAVMVAVLKRLSLDQQKALAEKMTQSCKYSLKFEPTFGSTRLHKEICSG